MDTVLVKALLITLVTFVVTYTFFWWMGKRIDKKLGLDKKEVE